MSTLAPGAFDLFVEFNDWWADRLGVRDEFAEIDSVLEQVVGDATARERCRARLLGPLGEQLGAMSMRVLLHEFHDFRRSLGRPLDPSGDEALRTFLAMSTDETRAAVLERFPVMNERARRLISVRTAAVVEVLERLRDDRVALDDAGFVAREVDVALLRPSGGDAHNGGRTVLAVDFVDGSTVMYKPRSMSSDRFARDVLAAAGPYVLHDLEACIPDSLDRGPYGWQRFVATRPSLSASEANAYFYRYGALCALLGAIGTTDLHNENVVACGGVPVVVDTETILRMGLGSPTGSLLETMVTTSGYSAAAASLVPARAAGAPVDAILAGIGVLEHQHMTRTQPRLVDTGTDAMRLEQAPIDLAPTEENIPRLGDRRLAVSDHLDQLSAGFRDAMRAVRSGAVSDALRAAEPCLVRYVLRATFVYAQFLDASFHPRYADDRGHLDALLTRLGTRSVESAAQPAVARHERAALFDGDVPLFDGWSDERVIRCGGDVVPSAMIQSPLDNALCGVELAAANSDEYHLAVLEACLAETAGDDADLIAGSVFARLIDPAEPGDVAVRAADLLAATAVRFVGDDGSQLGWVLATGDGSTTLSVGQSMGFHDAGGMVAFLQRMRDRSGGDDGRAAAAVRGLLALADAGKPAREGQPHPLLVRPRSVFGGAASLLMSVPDVPESWFDLSFAARSRASAADRPGPAGHEPDLVFGSAGLAMLAAADPRVSERVGEERWTELVGDVRAAIRTGWTGDRAWFDLAHGALGLHWALARIGRTTGRVDLAAEAAGWIAEQIAGCEWPTVGGWCNGAGGLILASAEAAAATGSDQLLDQLLDGQLAKRCWAVLDGDGPVDISVCHGTSGAVQSLLAAGMLIDESSLIDQAVDLHGATLREVSLRGARTGSHRHVAMTGYMLGWSGYADTDLLIASVMDGDRRLSVPASLVPFGRPLR